jgi:hypothetical protein
MFPMLNGRLGRTPSNTVCAKYWYSGTCACCLGPRILPGFVHETCFTTGRGFLLRSSPVLSLGAGLCLQVVRLSEVHGRQVLQEAPQMATAAAAATATTGTPADISSTASSSGSSAGMPGAAAVAGSSRASQQAGSGEQASTSGRPAGVAGLRSGAGAHSSDGGAWMQTILRQLVGANAAAEIGVDRGKPAPQRAPDEPGGAPVSAGA